MSSYFRCLLIAYLCASLSAWGDAQAQAPKKVELTAGLSIFVPYGLHRLNKTDIQSKYPQPTPPLAVYEDQEGYISWIFTLKPTHWRPQDARLMQNFLRANIESLYERNVKWIEEGFKPIKGQEAVYMRFIGTHRSKQAIRSKTKRSYHAILSLILKEQQLILHFTCPASSYPQWEEQITQSIESLDLR